MPGRTRGALNADSERLITAGNEQGRFHGWTKEMKRDVWVRLTVCLTSGFLMCLARSPRASRRAIRRSVVVHDDGDAIRVAYTLRL